MSKFKICMALALSLLAGCSFRVNLARQRLAYDAFDNFAPRAQADYEVKEALYEEILKQTSTPKVEPYPQLRADLTEGRNAIQAMQERLKDVHKAKQRFDAFAQGRSEVSSDNKDDWQAYTQVQEQFRAAGEQMLAYQGQHQQALAQFDSRLRQFKIMKVDLKKVGDEVGAFQSEFGQGLADMQAGLADDTKALSFAKVAGIAPDRLAQKTDVLGKMAALLPPLEDQKKAVGSLKLPSTGGKDGMVWVGPGMRGDLSQLDAFYSAEKLYRKSRADFDAMKKDFEAAPTPTPAPTVQAAAPTTKTATAK